MEAAINWIVEHENDADVDEVPMVCFLGNSIALIMNFISLQSCHTIYHFFMRF